MGPFGAGDTPLQHYNSVLALQHLQAYADCVVYRGNDDLLRGVAETSARSNNTVAGGYAQRLVGDGGGGGPKGGGDGGVGWLPVGPSSRPGGGANNPAAGRRRGLPVSTADMNASFAVDMASYFFPTSLPFDRFGRSVAPDTSDRHHNHHPRRRRHRQQQQQQQQRKQETAPRPFDGGSLMAAACPLPGAKFVDLRSSLSVGPTAAAAAAAAADPGLAATVANKDWAALATDLGRRAPLCPRKGGGLDDDACVAAHHVVRGVGATVGPRAGGGSWSAVGAGAAAEGSRSVSVAGRGKHGGGGGRGGGGGGGGGGGVGSSAAALCLEEGAGVASEALRRHHECPAWRTATDVSCAPGMNTIR